MRRHFQGVEYEVVAGAYNGPISGYLLGGVLRSSKWRFTSTKGYISTPEGIVVVLGLKGSIVLVTAAILLILFAVLLYPHKYIKYYPVSFCETPVYQDGVLYCNVNNDADQDITVQFREGHSTTQEYLLHSGESLPYITIDFPPDTIRYNGESDFRIEVKHDGF